MIKFQPKNLFSSLGLEKSIKRNGIKGNLGDPSLERGETESCVAVQDEGPNNTFCTHLLDKLSVCVIITNWSNCMLTVPGWKNRAFFGWWKKWIGYRWYSRYYHWNIKNRQKLISRKASSANSVNYGGTGTFVIWFVYVYLTIKLHIHYPCPSFSGLGIYWWFDTTFHCSFPIVDSPNFACCL